MPLIYEVNGKAPPDLLHGHVPDLLHISVPASYSDVQLRICFGCNVGFDICPALGTIPGLVRLQSCECGSGQVKTVLVTGTLPWYPRTM